MDQQQTPETQTYWQPAPEVPTYWQQPAPPPVAPWNAPRPGMSAGQITFNVIILALLGINLLLTLYVFGVVREAVNAVHSVGSLFGG